MTNLYLLCGIPGSGKSTWARKFIESNKNSIWISRDKIRYSFLTEHDDYFANEQKVFATFILDINNAIGKYENIIIDATHLNEKSRNKILDELFINEEINIHAINFLLSTKECISRNKKRTGRERLPEDVIKNMSKRFMPASHGEKYYYNEIQNIWE